jgi:hypothetical protein
MSEIQILQFNNEVQHLLGSDRMGLTEIRKE